MTLSEPYARLGVSPLGKHEGMAKCAARQALQARWFFPRMNPLLFAIAC
jgi:hypothetical protein